MTENYKKGIGRLATDRYDFQKHLDGYSSPGLNLRHTADQMDMQTPVINGALTVQESFDELADFMVDQLAAGAGFVAFGDGYNTWHAADGNINFDNTIPSLDTALNPIFDKIYDGLDLPAEFERIKFGGTVLIKAGTYIVKDTINIPPGISLIGEGFGTKIINATNLDTTSLPPITNSVIAINGATNASPIVISTSSNHGFTTGTVVNVFGVAGNTAANGSWTITVNSSTQFALNGSTGSGSYTSGGNVNKCKPVFRALEDLYRSSTDSAVNSTLFMFSRETKISNMVIADNFVEPTILGDIYYKSVQNYGGKIPLIEQMSNSFLTCDNVIFSGRCPSDTSCTETAIKLNAANVDSGTILSIKNCFMDGFKVPFIWNSSAHSESYMSIVNSKIRSLGYLNNDVSSESNNCFININDNNLNVSNNFFYVNTDNIKTLAYVNEVDASSVPLQSRAKMLFSSNQIVSNKGDSSPTVFNFIAKNSSIIDALSSKINVISMANTYEGSTSFSISLGCQLLPLDSSYKPQLELKESSIDFRAPSIFDGYVVQKSSLYIKPVYVNGYHGIEDDDYLLLVDTRSGTAFITIPHGIEGRMLIIKDQYGTFATNSLTINRDDTNQYIDDYLGDKIISSDWASITLYCDGDNWLIL